MATAPIARTPVSRSSARVDSPTGSARTAGMTRASRACGMVVSKRPPPPMTAPESPPRISTTASELERPSCYARYHLIHVPEPGSGAADQSERFGRDEHLCVRRGGQGAPARKAGFPQTAHGATSKPGPLEADGRYADDRPDGPVQRSGSHSTTPANHPEQQQHADHLSGGRTQ